MLRDRRWGRVWGFLGLLGACGVEGRAAQVVVPNAYASVEGDATFSTSPGPRRYQQVFDASQFAGLGGPILLTGVELRPDASQLSAASVSYPLIELYHATTSRMAATLSSTFADNVGPDYVLSYSGPLTISTANAPGPGTTKAFDIFFPFTTPFLYDPSAGNLLSDGRFATNSGEILLDFVSDDPTTGVVYSDVSESATTGTVVAFGAVARYTFTVVPEPSTMVLAGLGTCGLIGHGWRRRARRAVS